MTDSETRPMTSDEAAARRRTALHEAGHAAADVVLGLPLEYASIRAGRTFAGVAVPVARDLRDADKLTMYPTMLQPPALRDDVERRVISMLAGALAELYLGELPPPRDYSDDEALAIARAALARLPPRLAELVVHHEEREDPTGGDEDNAYGLAEAIVGPEAAELYLALLRHEARALVVRYHAAIRSVADALERHAVLSGDAVAALVKGVPDA